jgi:hypothetical protein
VLGARGESWAHGAIAEARGDGAVGGEGCGGGSDGGGGASGGGVAAPSRGRTGVGRGSRGRV